MISQWKVLKLAPKLIWYTLKSTSIRIAPKFSNLSTSDVSKQGPVPNLDHLPFRSTMARVYGILVSNLPPTTEPLAIQMFFRSHQLNPYELQVRSCLTSTKYELVERPEACFHFLSNSEKDNAMLMAYGAKFGNHIIKAKSCLCEKPLAGETSKNSAKKIGIPPKKLQDREKKTTLAIPQASRMNKARILSKNSFYFESRGRRHFARLHPSACGNSETTFPESSRSSRDRELARVRADAQRSAVKKNDLSLQPTTKHIPIWSRTEESEYSSTLADSRTKRIDVGSTDSRPVNRTTTKIHGVQVSKLNYARTKRS